MTEIPVKATPRILVGTLACGEAELDECCHAIAEQQNVVVDHRVFHDLPELEAHRQLFSLWNTEKGAFDLFAKIDADTVLCRNTALAEVWEIFRSDDDITGLQAGLIDYFSNRMIAGLNFFSSQVTFSVPEDELYCDRVIEEGHRRVLKPDDTLSLYPIGWHGRYPHPLQAFHFGYRRMLKGQEPYLRGLIDAWRDNAEDGRFWALCGARTAYFRPLADTSYGSKLFRQLFDDIDRQVKSGKAVPVDVVRDVENILDRGLGVRLRRLATRHVPFGSRLFG